MPGSNSHLKIHQSNSFIASKHSDAGGLWSCPSALAAIPYTTATINASARLGFECETLPVKLSAEKPIHLVFILGTSSMGINPEFVRKSRESLHFLNNIITSKAEVAEGNSTHEEILAEQLKVFQGVDFVAMSTNAFGDYEKNNYYILVTTAYKASPAMSMALKLMKQNDIVEPFVSEVPSYTELKEHAHTFLYCGDPDPERNAWPHTADSQHDAWAAIQQAVGDPCLSPHNRADPIF